MAYYFNRYCKDYQNIENYEKAKADNFKGWCIHHRLETHNSDGERRLVDIAAAELQALGMYYNRPAAELIFLTISEHSMLHAKGKKGSEETKLKMSTSHKGKKFSEEHREALSEAHRGEKHYMYGKRHSIEVNEKISKALKGRPSQNKGKHWYNNGKICVRANECPDGFVPGMLRI